MSCNIQFFFIRDGFRFFVELTIEVIVIDTENFVSIDIRRGFLEVFKENFRIIDQIVRGGPFRELDNAAF